MGMLKFWKALLLLAFAGLNLLFFAKLTGIWPSVGFVILFLIWCSPGVPLARFLLGKNCRRDPFFWLVALTGGYHLSSLLSILLILAVGMRPQIIFPSLLLMGIAAYILVFRHEGAKTGSLSSAVPSREETSAWVLFAICTAIVQLLVMQPFLHVGLSTPGGLTYRAYFNGDLLKHVAIAGELGKGNIPPQNPYFSGENLHYYWLYYLFPAIAGSALSQRVGLDRCMLLMGWVMIPVTILGLQQWLYRFAARTRCVLFAILIVLLAYSYEGLMVIQDLYRQHHPWFQFVKYNVDAATRWLIGPPEIDGFYRAFLYNPQHLFSLCLMIVVFVLLKEVGTSLTLRKACGAVFLLGGVVGYSAFLGYAALFWIAVWLLFDFRNVTDRFIRFPFFWVFSVAATVFYGVLYFKYPGMFKPRAGELLFSADRAIISYPIAILLLNFGPAFLLGIAGLFAGVWRKDRTVLAPAILLFITLTNIVFIYDKWGPSDVAVKLGYACFLALSATTAYLFSLVDFKTWTARLVGILLVGLSLPALLTTAMEWYNSQDIRNKHWTTFINMNDMNACLWIRDNTSSSAVFQSYPRYDSVGMFTLLPSFAYRHVAVGDPMHSLIFEINPEEYARRKLLVDMMFSTRSAGIAYLITCGLGIDYVYTAPVKVKDVVVLDKFKDPDLFHPVYAKGSVQILRILHGDVKNPFLPDTSEIYSSKGITLQFGKGFYDKERSPGSPFSFRWARQKACLIVSSSESRKIDLAFRILSRSRSRRLELQQDEKVMETMNVGTSWVLVDLQNLLLHQGANEIFLFTRDGEEALDLEGITKDTRLASFSFGYPVVLCDSHLY